MNFTYYFQDYLLIESTREEYILKRYGIQLLKVWNKHNFKDSHPSMSLEEIYQYISTRTSKSYIESVIIWFINEEIYFNNQQEYNEVKGYLEKFIRYKSKIPENQRNINELKYIELKEIIDNIDLDSRRQQMINDKEAKIFYKDSDIEVTQIFTYEAAKSFGPMHRTRDLWCIRDRKTNSHFDRYMKSDTDEMFFILAGSEWYLLYFGHLSDFNGEGAEFKDIDDKEFEVQELIDKYPTLLTIFSDKAVDHDYYPLIIKDSKFIKHNSKYFKISEDKGIVIFTMKASDEIVTFYNAMYSNYKVLQKFPLNWLETLPDGDIYEVYIIYFDNEKIELLANSAKRDYHFLSLSVTKSGFTYNNEIGQCVNKFNEISTQYPIITKIANDISSKNYYSLINKSNDIKHLFSYLRQIKFLTDIAMQHFINDISSFSFIFDFSPIKDEDKHIFVSFLLQKLLNYSKVKQLIESEDKVLCKIYNSFYILQYKPTSEMQFYKIVNDSLVKIKSEDIEKIEKHQELFDKFAEQFTKKLDIQKSIGYEWK